MAPVAARASGSSIPWEDRDRIGFVSAFIETSKQVITAPSSFFQRMPVVGGIPSPMLYGVIAGYLGLAFQTVYSTVLQTVFGTSFLNLARGEEHQALGLLQGGLGLLFQLVIGPIQVIIGLFLATAVYHVMLLVFGGARKGFEATFGVVCYAQAASMLGVVPVCGFLAGFYVVVLNIIGLSEAHGISGGKAAAAVLVPILLVCCCCALGLGVLFGGMASIFSQLQPR
jgi:hypothetical protein